MHHNPHSLTLPASCFLICLLFLASSLPILVIYYICAVIDWSPPPPSRYPRACWHVDLKISSKMCRWASLHFSPILRAMNTKQMVIQMNHTGYLFMFFHQQQISKCGVSVSTFLSSVLLIFVLFTVLFSIFIWLYHFQFYWNTTITSPLQTHTHFYKSK